VDTNSLGLRDRPIDFAAPFSGKTVVLAGDSFVFGHGINVSDRLDTHLASLLDPQEKRCRVINAGVPGWGTIQAARFVLDHLDLLRPDAVVLVFCGNDPEDDTEFLNNTGMYVGNTKFANFPGKDFLRTHSHLYRFLLYRATILRHDRTVQARQRRGEQLVLDSQTAEPISPQDWARTLDIIRNFHRDLLARDARAVLFITASNPRQEDIRQHLASLDNGGSLRFIDLAPACSDLKPDQMHLDFDQHWSPLMHKTAAQAIYNALILK
jgi:lysophospholipase L1-like esterase